MTAEKTISVKITRPSLSGVIQRKRLFSILTDLAAKPVIWISSPAGSGKTTLVSSYLDFRQLPRIWYQCDEGDSDLATFFYYMGLAARKAAPRYKKSLPLLTPEYLASIPIFTRIYFETLYSRLLTPQGAAGPQHGFSIVLDNYQDVPGDSPFHDMIANGLEMIPEGVRVIVISRSDPPAAFARLQANDKISLFPHGDIRFTLKESKELLYGRIPELGSRAMKTIYERTEGWAAGIILMLERARLKGTQMEPAADFADGRIFDYFAGEIFDKTPKAVQDFLLKTAFLPMLSVSLAEKLTGVRNAGRILATLNRHNYFTERLTGGGYGYQFHPLFRDFLLNRVKTKSTPAELVHMQKAAAALLEQSGQIEDAARLYSDAGEGQYLARMVIHHAREFLGQGRNKTVAEWIAGIPGRMAGDNPWLLYWTGMCSFPFDMPNARKYLEKSFALFQAVDDTSGLYLSWAGIVDTYTFELGEWKHLDRCIDLFEELRRTYPSFPSRETDLIASSRMLISLILRKTDQPKWVLQWFDRMSALLQETPSVDIQMDTAFFMSVYYLWKGEYHRNALLLQRAEADILHHAPSPFAVIRNKMMIGTHYWVTAQYDSALKTLSEGLDIAQESGVHVFDSLLWSFRAATEMATGHKDIAVKSLKNQMKTGLETANTLDIFFYHINCAWHALLNGNVSLAFENMETISAMTAKMGTPYYRALWNVGMAQVEFLQGRTKEAGSRISKAQRIGRDMKSQVIEWYSLLIDAWFLLQEGRESEGLGSLRRGLSLGRKHGYVHLEFYQPSVMQFLCARALEEGIETGYIQGLIRTLKLAPPANDQGEASARFIHDWPYPIKIFTLGRFEVLKDDGPLGYAGKVQKKPLEMLKAIIAAGGTNVPAGHLTDALWPDADGDLAHKSFEMTLSRLRRLLGGDDFIRYSTGQLSIDLQSCQVDSIALTHLIGEIRKSPDDQIVGLCEKALSLYKGPFLPADTGMPWAVHKREMLKSSLLHIIITTGRHYEQAGEWERAAEYYIKGLDTDNLAEIFYQRLMICYQKLGSNADAVRTYNRCVSLLHDNLGIRPSAETGAIYSSLIPRK
jgi:LuxR family transcriptional regulator, maltose regulon positive regulatory protein